MIAALPMYDWPELREAHDNYWRALRKNLNTQGIDAPLNLTRDDDDHSHWLSPELLLGQTCGYPFSTTLVGKVRYLATPQYGVEGCEGPNYSSAIIVHKDCGLEMSKMRGTSLAFNSKSSWSGYRTLVLQFGSLDKYFLALHESGGHRNSARMVASRKSDVAAIDAVCWHLLQRFEPDTANNLRVIGWTKPQPALPFITSIEQSAETILALQHALEEVLSSANFANNLLALEGIEVLDEQAYAHMANVGA